MYNILDIVVLDDKKEYVVASKAQVAGETFYLLAEVNNYKNVKYYQEVDNGTSLAQVRDKKILSDLAIVLYENSKKFYEEID